jgi:hypothetical protein
VKTAKTNKRNQKHAKKEKRDNTHETGKQITRKSKIFQFVFELYTFLDSRGIIGFSRDWGAGKFSVCGWQWNRSVPVEEFMGFPGFSVKICLDKKFVLKSRHFLFGIVRKFWIVV